jgi:hypothetical protein
MRSAVPPILFYNERGSEHAHRIRIIGYLQRLGSASHVFHARTIK